MLEDPIVIVGMARTPMGSFQGDLKDATGPELGAAAIGVVGVERLAGPGGPGEHDRQHHGDDHDRPDQQPCPALSWPSPHERASSSSRASTPAACREPAGCSP